MQKEKSQNNFYINREISWIHFNKRVLELAIDTRTPLLEKLKFSAIFSNNLDEFFMVRVASLKSQVEAEVNKKSEDGQTPKEQLANIRKELLPLLHQQQEASNRYIKKDLRKENIYILDYSELNPEQKNWVDEYFKIAIFPILTPLAVDPAHPFPFVSNLSLNLAALIVDPENNKEQFTRVKIPQKTINRFIKIPSKLTKDSSHHNAIAIEQIIAFNLKELFPGMKVKEHSFFRVTRDADLELRELEADDLMSALEEGLRKRRMGGEIVRLEVSETIPNSILDLLISGMSIKQEDLYRIKGILGLDELIYLMQIEKSKLKFEPHFGLTHSRLKCIAQSPIEKRSTQQKEIRDIFSIIKEKDLLLHHPFDLFSTSIEEFINQAANDKDVMAIKMTLYRISKDSGIIEALIRAVENGKQVMALVELKARFDEDNNIQWAKQLEQSGVHVVYGVIGLKTHTKIALVIRKEKEILNTYFHIGTGNYNLKTSKLYTDLGLLSAQEEIGQDLIELFNYLTGFSKQQEYQKLLVAPVTLRTGIEKLILQEIENAKANKIARIRAKMNSLVDPNIINLLYKASQSGVKIELIIRGMCCLIPGRKNLSENIKVISVIGRFLEHSRIFWFSNNGNPKAYIGSADWMRRNLDKRIEAVVPIEDFTILKEIDTLLSTYIEQSYASWEMQNDGTFIQQNETGIEKIFVQEKLIKDWNNASHVAS